MSKGSILIADDDAGIRTVLDHALGRAGYEVKATANAATLWRWIGDGQGDLVITDVLMPDENGLDLLPRIKKMRPEIPVIVLSAHSTIMTAIKAAERGAHEYLPKPFDLKELIKVVQRALNNGQPFVGGNTLVDQGEEVLPVIGRSPAMQQIFRAVARLLQSDLTVMISGESGTGKELVARALHDYGKRRYGPFIGINMAAIPRDLIESQLFGHERGAFTGAINRNSGHFELAEGGTLFLDEVGDMSPEAQTRLLRVLQQGEYSTIGGRVTIKTNVRIIAATNHDLLKKIDQGLFREDLFYRLNVVPMRLPPLRERTEDIPDLVQHFLKQAEVSGLQTKQLSRDAMLVLRSYDWPGNVRELENLIRRLIALYPEEIIEKSVIEEEILAGDETGKNSSTLANSRVDGDNVSASIAQHLTRYFQAHGDNLPPDGLYERIIREVERPLIQQCLSATRGNQIKTARLLGINRNTLRKKIRGLNIQVKRGLN